jgi:hypothetical protein
MRGQPAKKNTADSTAGTRRAVLHLRGIGEDVPAGAMLQVADEVRQAVTRLGIVEVRIEVKSDADEAAASGGPPTVCQFSHIDLAFMSL